MTKTGGIANSTSTRKRVARLFRLKEDRRSGPHDRRRRPQFSVTKERPDWPPDDGWIRPSPHRRDLLRTSRSFTQIRFALRPLLTNDRRGRATARFGRRANLELQASSSLFLYLRDPFLLSSCTHFGSCTKDLGCLIYGGKGRRGEVTEI